MIDTDKLAFKNMLVAVFSIYNKPPPDKDIMRMWWDKLERFEFNVIGPAFDRWTDIPNKLPQPADIVILCRPQQEIYKALPAPVDVESNQKHADELAIFIHERLKPKTDFHAWAKRIMANPKNFPDKSVEEAKKVLKLA